MVLFRAPSDPAFGRADREVSQRGVREMSPLPARRAQCHRALGLSFVKQVGHNRQSLSCHRYLLGGVMW